MVAITLEMERINERNHLIQRIVDDKFRRCIATNTSFKLAVAIFIYMLIASIYMAHISKIIILLHLYLL